MLAAVADFSGCDGLTFGHGQERGRVDRMGEGSGGHLAGAGPVGVDEHIGGCPVAQGAGLTCRLLASLNAGGTVGHALRCGRTLGSHQEATPAGVTGCHVVGEAVAAGLADAPETLRPRLAPLVGVAGMAGAEL